MVWSGSIFTLLNPPQFGSGYLSLINPNQPDWVGLPGGAPMGWVYPTRLGWVNPMG